jgi:hypothetical protein
MANNVHAAAAAAAAAAHAAAVNARLRLGSSSVNKDGNDMIQKSDNTTTVAINNIGRVISCCSGEEQFTDTITDAAAAAAAAYYQRKVVGDVVGCKVHAYFGSVRYGAREMICEEREREREITEIYFRWEPI